MIFDCPGCTVATSPAPVCAALTVGAKQLGLLLPCATNLVTGPALVYIDVADKIVQGVVPLQVLAPGMLNVEVWTHGKFVERLTGDGKGGFVGTLDLSQEPIGPIQVRFLAWDSIPGDNSYTINLKGELTLFVKECQ